MSGRGIIEKDLSDQQTILRSWSIKRYASRIPQYIQLFRPENKIHVNFAEHLICEDELKYALLASNCIFPGLSTFITILMNKITEEYAYSL
jgi:potassium channel subfamily T protein 1